MYPQWGDGSNQRMLGQISGQYEPSQDHDGKHLIEGTIENVIIISMVMWLIKRMFHRPLAALVFIGGMIATAVISVHEQHFYPMVWFAVGVALIGFVQVVRLHRSF